VDFLIADVLLKEATSIRRASKPICARGAVGPSFPTGAPGLGKSYFRSNHVAEAARELEQVIKLDPQVAEAYYQLGRVYTRLKAHG